MTKYIKFSFVDKNGFFKVEEFKIDFNGFNDKKAFVTVYNTWYCKNHALKMYYRQERTWNDHLGNTESGYYVNIVFPYGIGKRRIYVLF